ncbi:MAG: EamA family transporter [Acidimicrobiales bacterium]
MASTVSAQCGSAIATRLIGVVGPAGAVTLRLVFACVALAVTSTVVARRRRPKASVRGRLGALLSRNRRRDVAVMFVFGLTLAGMNLCFYEAIGRVPLGVAVTLEFAGPLAVSLAGSRRALHFLWAAFAGAGVLLLAGGSLLSGSGALHHLDSTGVGFALLAGALWAAYILMNRETGRRFSGTWGLAGAMTVAAVTMAPFGVISDGVALVRPSVIGVGIAVALLSSAIPYSFEVAALRRATPRAFGILLSIAPAVAALAGFVILGQGLTGAEAVALVLVVAANFGSSLTSRRAGAAGAAGAV